MKMGGSFLLGSIILILSVGVFGPLPARAESVLICKVETKSNCDSNGCMSRFENKEYVVFRPQAQAYDLCRSDGGKCRSLEVTTVQKSGAFSFIRFGPGSAYMKVVTTAVEGLHFGSFVEVRDNFLGATISFGKC